MKTVNYDEFQSALCKLQEEIDPDRTVDVHNMRHYGSDCIVQLGIGWASIGVKGIDETKVFAEKINRAITGVGNFKYNGYKIVF